MKKVAVGSSIVARLAVAAALLFASAADAQTPSPFVPPAPPKPKILRLLAEAYAIDPRSLEDFEHATGWAVAYDSYDPSDSIAEKWREGPYDLVELSGPALTRRIAAGSLAKLDKAKLPFARAVQPPVAAKLAAYDTAGTYSIAYGWSAFGLLYDADKSAKRIAGAPVSWGQLLLPREAGRMADCGVALPDARDAMFVAVWRMMGVDPAKATLPQVKIAANVLDRARPSLLAVGIPDVVGALARGSACLSAGSAGEADAAAARARDSGSKAAINFAYPREGGPMTIEAFAIPRDTATPEQAYALLDFLLRPDIEARDAKAAGLVSSEDAGQIDALKRLTPEPVFDDRLAAAMETEWKRLRAAK